MRIVQATGECASPQAAIARSSSSLTPSAPSRAFTRRPVTEGAPSSMPRMRRWSLSASAITSRVVSATPRRAARIAITVAVHAASAARISQPGLGALPSPPMDPGMSVYTSSPPAPFTSNLSPSTRRATSAAAVLRAFAGSCASAWLVRSIDSRMAAVSIVFLLKIIGSWVRANREHNLKRAAAGALATILQ